MPLEQRLVLSGLIAALGGCMDYGRIGCKQLRRPLKKPLLDGAHTCRTRDPRSWWCRRSRAQQSAPWESQRQSSAPPAPTAGCPPHIQMRSRLEAPRPLGTRDLDRQESIVSGRRPIGHAEESLRQV